MGWIEYFFGRDNRPRIPHHLVHPFDRTRATDDELLVLKAGRARDQQYIERLMVKYQARNAAELLARLPKHKQKPFRQRVKTLIARWEGAFPYDPIRRELHYIRQKERDGSETGIRVGRLTDRRR